MDTMMATYMNKHEKYACLSTIAIITIAEEKKNELTKASI